MPYLRTSPIPSAPHLNSFQADWQWQLTPSTNPQQTLATSQAHLALVANDNGRLVRQEPIILTLPFTNAREGITLAEAQDILANGHEHITVTSWKELTPAQKALRVDGRHPTDPDYPLQRSWSLIAQTDYQTAANDLAEHLSNHWPTTPIVHLAAVGDIMLDRALGFALQKDDLAYPFNGVVEPLRAADITIGNLESALGGCR